MKMKMFQKCFSYFPDESQHFQWRDEMLREQRIKFNLIFARGKSKKIFA